MSLRKRNTKTKKGKKRTQSPDWAVRGARPQLTRMATMIPREVDTLLEFTYSSILNAAAATSKGVRFQVNCAYDVDPVLGSTATPGFVEWSAFYQQYRVVGYRYVFTVVNKEAFPVLAVVVNTNVDPGVGGYATYMGNPNTQKCLLSSNTGGPCTHTFRGSHTTANIAGSIVAETDDSYASLVNTVPLNKIFCGLAIDGIGSNVTAGVTYLFTCKMKIRFYERKQLSS